MLRRQTLQPAGETDIGWTTGLLALTYGASPIAEWAMSATGVRDTLATFYLGPIVEYALGRGEVDVVGDHTVAVWTPSAQPLPPEQMDRFGRIWGSRALERLPLLHDILAARRPPGHDYLALIAVSVSRRGRGIGSSLLAHHHARLDRRTRTAYLEAPPDSTRFYQRAGYTATGAPVQLPGPGPVLQPMARPPLPTTTSTTARVESSR
ncbi:GNAT family N-acetyltransferase [Catenuloplanes japonicus]|uniref:GNAT family N-acetyltransferase n=1 Tax=Catenuloplanes japonicus TaxID=33876 RepID=UPI00068DD839|nr:GNAT family N-acetyltransferase [Catenuloplanes japonicus]